MTYNIIVKINNIYYYLLYFEHIIFTINNVSPWPESDHREHFNPQSIIFYCR